MQGLWMLMMPGSNSAKLKSGSAGRCRMISATYLAVSHRRPELQGYDFLFYTYLYK